MGTHILTTDGYNNEEGAVLFDSTNGWAFGPVFESGEQAEAFIQFVRESGKTVKDMSNGDLGYAHVKFLEEWKYCGLNEEERRQYDEYESDQTRVHWASPNKIFRRDERLTALKVKVEEARYDRWEL